MEKLTIQEEQALQAVFAVGEGNVKAVLEQLSEKVPYTTLASTIKNLEKKGYVSSRALGNTYIYKPAITETEFKQHYLHGVVKDYFSNSYKELVSFFVDQKKLSSDELKEIIRLIEK